MLQLILIAYLSVQSPPPGCDRTDPPGCEPRQPQITSVRIQNTHLNIRIMTPNLNELSDDQLLELHQNLHAMMLGHPVSNLPCPSELTGLLQQLEGNEDAIANLHKETEDAIASRPSITKTIQQMMEDLTGTYDDGEA